MGDLMVSAVGAKIERSGSQPSFSPGVQMVTNELNTEEGGGQPYDELASHQGGSTNTLTYLLHVTETGVKCQRYGLLGLNADFTFTFHSREK